MLTGLIACHTPEKNKTKKDIDLSKIPIKEIDTLKRKDSVDIKYKIDRFVNLFSYRFIGFVEDTIDLTQTLDENYDIKRYKILHWYYPSGSFEYPYMWLKDLHIQPPRRLELYLRTEVIYIHPFAGQNYRQNIGHPLILHNKNNDTFNISEYNSKLFIEALDSNLMWKPINDTFRLYCGTGVYGTNFFPNAVAVIPIPIFKGEFYTKMRVKLNGQYSNEIDAHIHYTQFHDDPQSE
ncbi:MAG: hypothetical protein ACOZCO_18295 [Bacteroidota bacterium]